MSVLVEAFSVVLKHETVANRFCGGMKRFAALVPNTTFCTDQELVRVGFMSPDDVGKFIELLGTHGIRYVVDGVAQDVIVIDQQQGPLVPCNWINAFYFDIEDDPDRRVVACMLADGKERRLSVPHGWQHPGQFGIVRTENSDEDLEFLRHENGLDVFFNRRTGKEVYVGRI